MDPDPTNAPPNSPVERGLFHRPSRHVCPTAANAAPAQPLLVQPPLPAFFPTSNPMRAPGPAQDHYLLSPPEDTRPPADDLPNDAAEDLHHHYYIPDPPAGTPRGPYDLRSPADRRALALAGLLPDQHRHRHQPAQPADAQQPAPPSSPALAAQALAECRAWWIATRPRLAPVLGRLTGRGAESGGGDPASEAWQDISVEEAEEAEEEQVEWETVWSRERGLVSRDGARRRTG